MIDSSYPSDRHPPVVIDQRWLGPFRVVTQQDGPGEFTAIVVLEGTPAFYGFGASQEEARFHSWQWIVATQRRVEDRRAA